MEASLQELNQKIDLLTAQVSYLSEQALLTERQCNERLELVRDVTPLANQAFNLAVEQLEEVQEYIDLSDLLRLFKRVLRNGRNLEKMLDQLESLADLLETLSPLADDAFRKVVDLMAGLEAKGYFSFTQGGMKILDNIVTSFNAEDVNRLGDNIILILNTVRDMAQPEIISFVHNTLLIAKKEIGKPVDNSYRGLVRLMRDPAVRRGMVLTLRVMQVIGAQAANQPIAGQ